MLHAGIIGRQEPRHVLVATRDLGRGEAIIGTVNENGQFRYRLCYRSESVADRSIALSQELRIRSADIIQISRSRPDSPMISPIADIKLGISLSAISSSLLISICSYM